MTIADFNTMPASANGSFLEPIGPSATIAGDKVNTSSGTDDLIKWVTTLHDEITLLLSGIPSEPDQSPAASAISQRAGTVKRLIDEVRREVGDVTKALRHSEQQLRDQRQQIDTIVAEARTDGLTGLLNRRVFEQEIARLCLESRNTAAVLSVLFIDIDRFKQLNDTFGHRIGDAALREIASLIRQDARSGDVVARYGGEEFGVILAGVRVEEAVRMAERIRRRVEVTTLRYDGTQISVTISCGVAQVLPREHLSELLRRADAAMYQSKQSGRNSTHWHDGRQLLTVANAPATVRRTREEKRESSVSAPVTFAPIEEDAAVLEPSAIGRSKHVANANWCDSKWLFWTLRQRIAEWKRGGDPFCLAMVAVDDFQKIVDKCGENGRDFVLRTNAYHVDASLRRTDVIANYGDTALAIFLPRTSPQDAMLVAERICHGAGKYTLPLGGESFEFTLSLGLTTVEEGDDPLRIFERTQSAMASAQVNGGNHCRLM